jgi:hypothetical protein
MSSPVDDGNEFVLQRVKEAIGASGLSNESAYRLTRKEWLLEPDRHVWSDSDIEFVSDLTGFSFDYLKFGNLKYVPDYLLKRIEQWEKNAHNNVVYIIERSRSY